MSSDFRKTLWIALLWGCIASGGGFALAGEDSEFRITFNTARVPLTEKWQTRTNIGTRITNEDWASNYRLSQRFYYEANKVWTLGIHPGIQLNRRDNNESYRDTYRVDFEANQEYSLNDKTELSFRTRWDVQWKEDAESAAHRTRQRAKITWDISARNPWFENYAFAGEVFYEIDNSKITSKRVYPLEFQLKGEGGLSTRFYYMYQSKRVGVSDDWNGLHALAVTFSL